MKSLETLKKMEYTIHDFFVLLEDTCLCSLCNNQFEVLDETQMTTHLLEEHGEFLDVRKIDSIFMRI